jgi:hypothetical protein
MEIPWVDNELLDIISLCLVQCISSHRKTSIKISNICFIFCQAASNTGKHNPTDILIFWIYKAIFMILLMQMPKFQALTFLLQLLMAASNRHTNTFHNTVMRLIMMFRSTTDRIYDGFPIRL